MSSIWLPASMRNVLISVLVVHKYFGKNQFSSRWLNSQSRLSWMAWCPSVSFFWNSTNKIQFSPGLRYLISSRSLIFFQTEIAKRLNAICAQIIPFLSQEHQQQVAQAVERAKQVTMAELNAIIGVSMVQFLDASSYLFVGRSVGPSVRRSFALL